MTSRTRNLVALAAALAAVTGLAAPAAQASRRQEAVFQDDPRLVSGSASQVVADMAILKSLGVDRVRVSLFWRLVAPEAESATRPSFNAADPASYPAGAWDRYDRIVQDARRDGISVYFTITGPAPLWASSQPGRGDHVYDPSPAQFQQFVTAVGRRYSGTYADEQPQPTPPPSGLPGLGGLLPGPPPAPTPAPTAPLPRVRFWSAWNEPNQPGWLRPQTSGGVPSSPRLYRALQDAGYAGLRASGHGSDTYVLAETAPRGSATTTAVSPMRPLLFIRELYCLNRKLRPLKGGAASARGCPTTAAGRSGFAAAHPGLFKATGWAHHPYAFEVKPTFKDRQRDQVTISTLKRLTTTLDKALARYGVRRHYPLYLTEYGYQTDPPDDFVGVSWRRQAAYLNQAEGIAFRNRRVRSFAQFLLFDDGPNLKFSPGDFRYYGSTFQTGLLTHTGARKPSFLSYQRPLDVSPARQRKGKKLAIVGALRAARNGARLTARIEFRKRGSKRWKRIKSVTTRNVRNYAYAKTKARATGYWRISWRNPAGGAALRTRAVYVKVTRPARSR